MQKLLNKFNQKFESVIKYAVAAVLLAVPLYPKFPFIRIPGTHVSIRLEDFVVLIAAFLAFSIILPTWRSFIKVKINQAIMLFWIIGLISTISAIFLTNTAPLTIATLHWIRRIEYISMFFVGVLAIKDKINLKFFIKCLILVVFFVFLFGLGQKYFSFPIVTTQNEEYAKGRALFYTVHGHLVSTFAGHYDMATVLILISPIFLTILLSKKALQEMDLSKYPLVSKLVLGFTWLECLWLLVYSASRISIVSYVVATVLALIFTRKYKAIIATIVVIFVFTLFSGNLLNRYQRIFDIVIEKITYQVDKALTVHAAGSVLAVEDVSSSIRFNVEWPRAIRAFTKNPLIGTGFSSITLATDNDYLRLIGELGLFGFIAFGLIFVRIFTVFFEKITILRENNLSSVYVASIFASIPGIFINAVFIDVFEASKFAIMFWLLVGLAVGLLKNEKV